MIDDARPTIGEARQAAKRQLSWLCISIGFALGFAFAVTLAAILNLIAVMLAGGA